MMLFCAEARIAIIIKLSVPALIVAGFLEGGHLAQRVISAAVIILLSGLDDVSRPIHLQEVKLHPLLVILELFGGDVDAEI